MRNQNGKYVVEIQKVPATWGRICSDADLPELAGVEEKLGPEFELRGESQP